MGPSMSLRVACRQMVSDRSIAKETYGKGSIEEKLLKLFVNGGYGKIAQNVIEKHTWDGWREEMDDIGCSAITSPERAALITDIVRCMLIGTMNQLSDRGLRTFSVTTDGFITEARTIDDHGFSPACMKQKCFRTSRAFYLVSVILSKKIKCFSRELSWGAGYWWLVEGRDIFPPLNLEN